MGCDHYDRIEQQTVREPALAIDTASNAAVVNLTRSLAIDDARLGIIRRGNVLLK
jgi:NAD(P)-dependent dehydrogenase (short-subunit alcohol dehydrogenase family)